MDIADLLKPTESKSEKDKYINRLKEFISAKPDSRTQKNLLNTLLEELKTRIEYTVGLSQGAAHKDRPGQGYAESVVLYTYLAIAELLSIYEQRTAQSKKD